MFCCTGATAVSTSDKPTIWARRFDPDLSWDDKKEVYRISNKIVRTMTITQSAVGDKRGLWSTVLAAAILMDDD